MISSGIFDLRWWAYLLIAFVLTHTTIAAVTILVLVEKMVPVGRVISRVTGAGLFAGGVWVLAQTL